MIISCNFSLNSTQNQMFLQFEEYMKQQLHSLHLDIQINKNDINDMKENMNDVTVNYKEICEFVIAQET
jgi:hypothetical protein